MFDRGRKKVGKYIFGKDLGEGSLGKVIAATDNTTKKKVALKIVSKNVIAGKRERLFKQHIYISNLLQHQNILQIKDIVEKQEYVYLVLEYLTSANRLSDMIGPKIARLSEPKARECLRQLVDAVGYCHQRGVSVRNLSPGNVLVDKFGQLKLADFRFAYYDKVVEDNRYSQLELLHHAWGDLNYSPPEITFGHKYDGYKIDIWSLGVILFELLAGFKPFESPTSVFQRTDGLIQDDEKVLNLQYPQWFSSEAIDLISRMLVPKFSTRISIEEVRSHDFFKEIPWTLWDFFTFRRRAKNPGERDPSLTCFGLACLP